MDVTKKDQVEALAMEHEHVDVLFNVAGYCFIFIQVFTITILTVVRKAHE